MYIIWYMCAWVCVLGVSVAGIVLVVVYICVCVYGIAWTSPQILTMYLHMRLAEL